MNNLKCLKFEKNLTNFIKENEKMYNDYYGSSSSNPLESLIRGFGNAQAIGIITIVCFVLAIIGGILALALFLAKKNENKFTGFVGWLYNFLNFKSMFAELLLKAMYLISAIFITLEYLGILFFTEGGSIGGKILTCLLGIIIANVVLRLVYEFLLVILVICRNTTEMNKKLGGGVFLNEESPKVESTKQPKEDGVVFCRNCGNKFNSNLPSCPSCGQQKN